MSLSVVLINFNGLQLMKNHLASIVDTLRAEAPETEFIIVDNASGDGSQEWLSDTYPDFKLLFQESNLFFAPAANLGITAAKNNLVLLLNPDVHAVAPDFLKVQKRFASDERLFALSPCLIDPRDGCQEKLYAYRCSFGTIDLLEPHNFSPEQERLIPYGT